MDDDNITKIALFRKGAVKILKSWVTWAIMLAGSSVAEIFNFINLVD